MTTENHARVMKLPIGCLTDRCELGTKPCATPLKCSGSERFADQAIADFRLHRVALPVTLEGEEPEEGDFALWGTASVVAAIVLAVAAGLSGAYAIACALGWL